MPRLTEAERSEFLPALDGWALVEATATGERLTPLVGWALLAPYVPFYRQGGESYTPAEQTVRGLIAPVGEPVWADTVIPVPEHLRGLPWRSILSGVSCDASNQASLRVADLTQTFPATVLLAERRPGGAIH